MESLTSPAAFVEGGVQDACDDACSICLEAFCESDPSTLTGCKHEFHLQCILECQELLEAVERERNIRTNQTRNTTIFHHPALGDFEVQHLPVVGNDAELEERILQHLAAAAAMGRSHQHGRREGQRNRSGSHGSPQFLVFSAHPNTPAGSVSSSSAQGEGADDLRILVPRVGDLPPHANPIEEAGNQSPGVLTYDAEQDAVVSSGNSTPVSSPRFFNRRHSSGQSTPVGNDRAGPSDVQSFSDSLKLRLNAVSSKYKESITKSTRGWKERLFSRNSSVSDLGSEKKRGGHHGAELTAALEKLAQLMSAKAAEGLPPASGTIVVPHADQVFKLELMPNDVKLNAIAMSVEALPTASVVWSMLSTWYSGKGNPMLMSQTEDKIHAVRQGDKSVLVYVNELQHLWADLDQCDPLEIPHAESMEIARKWVERRRVV
uniref:RING-type E3 ubiquitin transferase n=1 Tax=Aegilops tauschii TaxID=37682 RepID=N1QWD3_AEGTA